MPRSHRHPLADRLDLAGAFDRLLAQEARVSGAIARRPLLEGMSPTWPMRLLQAAAVIALMAVGVLIGQTIAWVVLAIPMTAIVLMALVGFDEHRTRSTAGTPSGIGEGVPGEMRITARRQSSTRATSADFTDAAGLLVE